MGIRVFQLASESGLSSAQVVSRCAELGVAAKNHMSVLTEQEAARVRSAIKKKILRNAVENELSPRQARTGAARQYDPEQPRPGPGLSSEAEQAARRHALRPGFRVADCREVALPIYKLYVVSVIEEHKPIPPIPEFLLKVINEGLGSIVEIGGFLGLEQPAVEDALIELMRSDDVHLAAPPGSRVQEFALSAKGRRTLEKSQFVVRQETTLPVHFDGLLRRVTSVGPSSFLTPKQVRESGATEIPPFPTTSPELDDLKLGELDQLFSRQFPGGDDKRRRKTRLLALKSLARRERFYQPAFALAYRAIDGDEVQVAFEIDGRLSQDHEEAFAHGDGPRRLGIVQSITTTRAERLLAQVLGRDVINEAQPSEELEGAKEEAGCAAAELEGAHEKLKSAETAEQRKAAEDVAHAAAQRLAASHAALAQHTTRHLGVFEHPPLLQKALQDTKERLLIISPWMTPEVVDGGFLGRCPLYGG